MHALAHLGLLNTELSTGDLRVRVAITVLRGVWWVEHDGLLICAVSADGAVTGVVPMISPSYSHRLLLSCDLQIRRLRQSSRTVCRRPCAGPTFDSCPSG